MTEFVVYTYDREINLLKSLVRRKQKIETGGDLFGLWLTTNEVVIQLISGPGKNCKRTQTSFHQDVSYLTNVGTHLTTKEGLCNVGEWHSHHRLGLARPSLGDEQTVWNSMPPALTKFVLFIANIRGSEKEPEVNVGCFLFDSISHEVVSGTFVYLSEPCSPLRRNKKIEKVLEDGAENYSAPKKPNGKKGKSPAGAGSFEDNSEVLGKKDEWEMKETKRGKRERRKSKITKKEEIIPGVGQDEINKTGNIRGRESNTKVEGKKLTGQKRNEATSGKKSSTKVEGKKLTGQKRNEATSGKKSSTKVEEKELTGQKRNETTSGKESSTKVEEKELTGQKSNEATSGKESSTKVEEKELTGQKRNEATSGKESSTKVEEKELTGINDEAVGGKEKGKEKGKGSIPRHQGKRKNNRKPQNKKKRK